MKIRDSARFHTALVALMLAGCGGGGSDATDVSASPEPPAPVAAAPSPSSSPPPSPSPSAPAPSGGTPIVAPPPSGAPAPQTPAPAPAAPKVAGELVWAALQASISPDPNSAAPFNTNYRKVYTDDRFFMHIGGDPNVLESHSFTSSPWGSLMKEGDVTVTVTGSDGVIDAVRANNLMMVGPQLDLRNVDPAVDASAGTWTNGEWFATLIVQSAESDDLMRVCWNVHLPPPPTVTGPPGTPPVVYTVPLRRLMCGVYSRVAAGPDVGGYVVDDFNGVVRTFRGTWQE